MQYLDYFDYIGIGGTVADDVAYSRLEFMARREVDYYTHQRIAEDLQKVSAVNKLPYCEPLQKLMYELIEICNNYGTSSNEKVITGTSNNGISVNYQVMTPQEIKANKRELITDYLKGCRDLKGIDLLWVGV